MEHNRVYYLDPYQNPKVEVTTLDQGVVIAIANRRPPACPAISESAYLKALAARARLLTTTAQALARDAAAHAAQRQQAKAKVLKKLGALGLDAADLEALFP